MKPNFKDINIKSTEKATTAAAEWEKANHIEKKLVDTRADTGKTRVHG